MNLQGTDLNGWSGIKALENIIVENFIVTMDLVLQKMKAINWKLVKRNQVTIITNNDEQSHDLTAGLIYMPILQETLSVFTNLCNNTASSPIDLWNRNKPTAENMQTQLTEYI